MATETGVFVENINKRTGTEMMLQHISRDFCYNTSPKMIKPSYDHVSAKAFHI